MAANRKSASFLQRHYALATEVSADLLREVKQLRTENYKLKKIIESESLCKRIAAWLVRR